MKYDFSWRVSIEGRTTEIEADSREEAEEILKEELLPYFIGLDDCCTIIEPLKKRDIDSITLDWEYEE